MLLSTAPLHVLTPTGPDVRMPSVFPPLREGPPLSDDVPVSVTVPSSAAKSVAGTYAQPEENDSLTFTPMSLVGSFTDHDMPKKQFVNVALPSGITTKKCVKVSMSDDLTSVVLMVLMPSLMTDSYLLHKDTMEGGVCPPTNKEAINRNLRVKNCNEVLADIGHKHDEPVWWKAVINLEEPACSNKFVRKKFKHCDSTGCLVLCLDVMVEDSDCMIEDDEFETV